MLKGLFLFGLLRFITGNTWISIILIVIIYYFIDRRYIGLFPSVIKPFRRLMRTSNLRRQIAMNPHDMPAKYDLARTYMEKRQYRGALRLLEDLSDTMKESEDVVYDTGVCYLALGNLEKGEQLVLRSLEKNKQLRYGEPYLKLAVAYSSSDPDKALRFVQEVQSYNFSSCESYYRMAQLHRHFGRKQEARDALRQCLDTYRVLPRFRRRTERRWAVLALLQSVLPS
ncbi:lipopolysaccharide assembly protein LapB [Alicyclobacillus sp. SO9]|uniref:tetratricopeptide repeat protein n=1 Tax=Alicyclobacillus sp. SO9 TaxID=2665646 RepID=UPI0018E90491|nr:tetratricopeptide repeat protein [Alicyclobacillus sp. SO9]QQE80133.1 tetratricopeptide repeat protein [Alicyclobacillus sp. SO9]